MPLVPILKEPVLASTIVTATFPAAVAVLDLTTAAATTIAVSCRMKDGYTATTGIIAAFVRLVGGAPREHGWGLRRWRVVRHSCSIR